MVLGAGIPLCPKLTRVIVALGAQEWLNRQTVSLVWMSPLGPGSSWQMAAWCLGVQGSDPDPGDSCSQEESGRKMGTGVGGGRVGDSCTPAWKVSA